MTYTAEQLQALAPYEEHFAKALRSNWCPYPGAEALRTIHRIFTEATGQKIRLNTGCSHCLLRIMKGAGQYYFEDKASLAAAKTARTKKAKKTEEDK